MEQSVSGKNQKDMASYKFWQTQPVPRFGPCSRSRYDHTLTCPMWIDDEPKKVAEGSIKVIDPETVSKEPSKMLDGFEWVTMDLTDEKEVPEHGDIWRSSMPNDDAARRSLRSPHWPLCRRRRRHVPFQLLPFIPKLVTLRPL